MAPTIEERLAFLESTLVGVQQNVTGVASDVANIQANDDGTGSAIFLSASDADTFWLIWAGVTVFFMQCGFGMLEAGSVRAKNTKNIMIKNLLDVCSGALAWFAFGSSIARDGEGAVFGLHSRSLFNVVEAEDGEGDADGYLLASWSFQFVFAATATTIVSGAMAERTQVGGH